jgi:hypothetical protein
MMCLPDFFQTYTFAVNSRAFIARIGGPAWRQRGRRGCGFSPQGSFTRMLLGRDQSFDDVARTYAVIGPEFG